MGHGGGVRDHPQRLHVPVAGTQHEQVGSLAARSAVEITVRRHGERGNGGVAVGNNIHRRVAEVARVNAVLEHHHGVIFGAALGAPERTRGGQQE